MTPSRLSVARAVTLTPATRMERSTASRAHCDRTITWVFSPATIIFDDLAHATTVSAAHLARRLAVSMSPPVQRAAVSSAYMYGEHPCL